MTNKNLYIETELDNNHYSPQTITLMDNGTVQPIGFVHFDNKKVKNDKQVTRWPIRKHQPKRDGSQD